MSDELRSHPVWVRGLKRSIICFSIFVGKVAPRVGAWIETPVNQMSRMEAAGSHPVWVRGLKQLQFEHERDQRQSHPVWVRGLKQKM